jgi:hypothetical protein
MAIYRKGDDLTSLQNAAKEQKTQRREAGPVVRAAAGRAPLSNAMVRPDSTAYKVDYEKPVLASGKRQTSEITNHPVSGTVVAERAAKMKAEGKLAELPSQGNRTVVGGGVINKGEVQKLSWKGKSYEKKTPKKKAAGVKDVREALKSGNISIEEAEGLNKKGLFSPIKKKKTK